MNAINHDMIRRFADINRSQVDEGSTTLTVVGRKLDLLPLPVEIVPNIPFQQRKILGLMRGFSRDINRKKTLTKDIWSGKFLQDLDLRLFGFLGDASRHLEDGFDFPRSDCLAKSKSFFMKDLEKMVHVVKKWRIESGRVVITPELQFSIGGDSEAFFRTLFWLRRLADGSSSGRFYAAQWARKTFGVYPGEHLAKGVDALWSPEDTAVLLRKSLTDENTINRVGRVINGIKRDHCVAILNEGGDSNINQEEFREQTFDDFGYIERMTLEDLKRVVYADFRKIRLINRLGNHGVDLVESYRLTSFELDVTEITPAGEYAGPIPSEVMENLEGFLSESIKALSDVPFVLTPELYVLTGPVKVRTTIVHVYLDPLLILRFREFPGLLIPVDYWLPVSRVYSVSEVFMM